MLELELERELVLELELELAQVVGKLREHLRMVLVQCFAVGAVKKLKTVSRIIINTQ